MTRSAARLLVVALWLAGCGSSDDGDGQRAFIDWARLRNPVLGFDDRALKDVAVAYHPGRKEFYVYSSTRFELDDANNTAAVRSFYRTSDWRRFEPFGDPDVNGAGYGPGSPDVSRIGIVWQMVFQVESPAGGSARTLAGSVSTNLVDWSPPEPVAAEVMDPSLRNIDGAVAEHGGYLYLGWKRVQEFFVTRRPLLGAGWEPPIEASAAGAWAENFQFIEIDGAWRMVATGYDPLLFRCTGHPTWITYTCNHEPFIYRMDGSGDDLQDWTRWVDKTHLQIPFEDWNPAMHANSAFLADWREHDGYFYLFYAGSLEGDRFELRGHGKIGVARSRDLVEWRVAGDMDD